MERRSDLRPLELCSSADGRDGEAPEFDGRYGVSLGPTSGSGCGFVSLIAAEDGGLPEHVQPRPLGVAMMVVIAGLVATVATSMLSIGFDIHRLAVLNQHGGRLSAQCRSVRR